MEPKCKNFLNKENSEISSALETVICTEIEQKVFLTSDFCTGCGAKNALGWKSFTRKSFVLSEKALKNNGFKRSMIAKTV